jgi:hypothetical protein
VSGLYRNQWNAPPGAARFIGESTIAVKTNTTSKGTARARRELLTESQRVSFHAPETGDNNVKAQENAPASRGCARGKRRCPPKGVRYEISVNGAEPARRPSASLRTGRRHEINVNGDGAVGWATREGRADETEEPGFTTEDTE